MTEEAGRRKYCRSECRPLATPIPIRSSFELTQAGSGAAALDSLQYHVDGFKREGSIQHRRRSLWAILQLVLWQRQAHTRELWEIIGVVSEKVRDDPACEAIIAALSLSLIERNTPHEQIEAPLNLFESLCLMLPKLSNNKEHIDNRITQASLGPPEENQSVMSRKRRRSSRKAFSVDPLATDTLAQEASTPETPQKPMGHGVFECLRNDQIFADVMKMLFSLNKFRCADEFCAALLALACLNRIFERLAQKMLMEVSIRRSALDGKIYSETCMSTDLIEKINTTFVSSVSSTIDCRMSALRMPDYCDSWETKVNFSVIWHILGIYDSMCFANQGDRLVSYIDIQNKPLLYWIASLFYSISDEILVKYLPSYFGDPSASRTVENSRKITPNAQFSSECRVWCSTLYPELTKEESIHCLDNPISTKCSLEVCDVWLLTIKVLLSFTKIEDKSATIKVDVLIKCLSALSSVRNKKGKEVHAERFVYDSILYISSLLTNIIIAGRHLAEASGGLRDILVDLLITETVDLLPIITDTEASINNNNELRKKCANNLSCHADEDVAPVSAISSVILSGHISLLIYVLSEKQHLGFATTLLPYKSWWLPMRCLKAFLAFQCSSSTVNKEEHIKLIVRAIRGMESSEETTIGPLFAAEDPKQSMDTPFKSNVDDEVSVRGFSLATDLFLNKKDCDKK